jgi:transcription attenuation protein (tryptophan RNA-binding attenuator protein)
VLSAGFSFESSRRVERGMGPMLESPVMGEYFVIRALENGVQVIGLTRGTETRFHHAEKLDKGELMLVQFTEHTSAMKIRGKVVLYTKHGTIPNSDSEV